MSDNKIKTLDVDIEEVKDDILFITGNESPREIKSSLDRFNKLAEIRLVCASLGLPIDVNNPALRDAKLVFSAYWGCIWADASLKTGVINAGGYEFNEPLKDGEKSIWDEFRSVDDDANTEETLRYANDLKECLSEFAKNQFGLSLEEYHKNELKYDDWEDKIRASDDKKAKQELHHNHIILREQGQRVTQEHHYRNLQRSRQYYKKKYNAYYLEEVNSFDDFVHKIWIPYYKEDGFYIPIKDKS